MSASSARPSISDTAHPAAPSPLRMAAAAVAVPASVGFIVGLILAAREALWNRYLAQGLWRTSLWLGCDWSAAGALAGACAGLYAAAWMIRRRPRHRLARGLYPLTVLIAIAVVLSPTKLPDVVGHPAWPMLACLLGLFCAIAIPGAVSDDGEAGSTASLDALWTAAVWLAYLVGLAYLWADLEPGAIMAAVASGGLLVALAIWSSGGGLFERGLSALRLFARSAAASDPPQSAPRLAVAVLALAVLLWVGGLAVGAQARAAAGARHRNLIIIALDTVRADRVSLLAKPAQGWDLTPNLRKLLAPHGIAFTRAYSQAPWTMPSFASIFTGLYQEQHGASTGEGHLAPEQLTLAELLRDAGYRTMAVVSGPFVTADVGMLQGFDQTDESQVIDEYAITSDKVTDRALDMLRANSGEPFFLFAHYFDPHWHYQHHNDFDFCTTHGSIDLPAKLNAAFVGRGRDASLRGKLPEIEALYAEDVAFTDLHIGRLLAYLDEHKLWDTTCVVLVADHGEEFLEHNSFQHGHSVFNEVLHVPLLIADPSRRGSRPTDDVVETRWLFATILNLLHIGRPKSTTPSFDLFDPPHGDDDLARASNHEPPQSCLIGRRYKMVRNLDKADSPPGRPALRPSRPAANWRGLPGGEAWFFDLQIDPGEKHDLTSDHPALATRSLSALKAMDGKLGARDLTAAAGVGAPTRDQIRRLKDFGYL